LRLWLGVWLPRCPAACFLALATSRAKGRTRANPPRIIALLRKTHSGAALRMLNEWRPAPAVSGVLKPIRWFAIDLLDAGVELDVQARRVTYMH
jgi:hypothetical protein